MTDFLSAAILKPRRRSRLRRILEIKLRRLSRRGRLAFPAALSFSISLHLLLFGVIVLQTSGISLGKKTAESLDLTAFRNAVSSLKKGQSMPRGGTVGALEAPSGPTLSPTDEEALTQILLQSPLFDPLISEEERTQIFQSLIRTYLRMKSDPNLAARLSLLTPQELLRLSQEDGWSAALSSRGRIYSRSELAEAGKPLFYKAKRAVEGRLDRLQKIDQGDEGIQRIAGDKVWFIGNDRRAWTMPSEYYFRTCPYQRILATGASLFYIIEGFPVLEEAPVLSSFDVARERKSIWTGSGEMVVLFMNSLPPGGLEFPSSFTRPVLSLSKEERQRILDDLMPLLESEQIFRFSEDYLDKYDPDKGDLPVLTQEFIYQNLKAVFVLPDVFAAAFDLLEEVFYNKEIQGFFAANWLKYSDTQTGGELLFALAALYEFESRCIRYLSEAQEIAKDILSGKDRRPSIYDRLAKAFVVQEVFNGLQAELEERKFQSLRDVQAVYEREQTKIYERLEKMGGETRNRALFTNGRYLWDEGRPDEAIRCWMKIDRDWSSTSFQQIRQIIAGEGALEYDVVGDINSMNLISRIDRVFNEESGSEKGDQFKRLQDFHKWKARSEALTKEGARSYR